MKITYKKIFTTFVTVLVAIPLYTPHSFAAEQSTQSFCSDFAVKATKLETGIAEKDAKLQQSRSEQNGELAKKRADQDSKLLETRTKADTVRAAQYDKLAKNAATDVQKQAVTDFKSSIETAVSVRKNKVDQSIKEFRIGVDTVVKNHTTAVNTALQTFQKSLDTALTKAKSSCANGKNPTTVRAEFTKSVKAAKDKLRLSRNKLPNIQTQINALAKIRKTNMENAFISFNTTFNNAAKALKSAFAK